MRAICTSITMVLAAVCIQPLARAADPLHGEPRPSESQTPARDWTKTLDGASKRDALHGAAQRVRGDSGKWNDDARLQVAPPIQKKPANVLLDDWSDQLIEREPQLSSGEDSWLIFRTQQLDDNDRVWIERVERRGNRFVVVANLAKWRGWYSKNFTYYNVLAVNLGRLEPGAYEAKWIVKPLVFSKFEPSAAPTDNWPKDEQAADEEPIELLVTFAVAERTR